MKVHYNILAIATVAATSLILFQNCAGGYNPSTYSDQSSTSVGPSPTSSPVAINCTVVATTGWIDSTSKIGCAISTATTIADGATATLNSNNGNTGTVQYLCVGGVATQVANSSNCSSPAPTPTPTATQPIIQTQPVSVTKNSGDSFSLSVVATGSNISYAWQKNGVPIVAATAATYTVASATTNDSGVYSVVVTSTAAASTAAVTSASATVIINLVHRWLFVGANTALPVGYTLDSTCERIVPRAGTYIPQHFGYSLGYLTGTICTVVGASCEDFTSSTLSWNLLKCQ